MKALFAFFRHGLWETDLRTRAWPVRISYSVLRVVAHVASSYEAHLLGLRAGGLTLVTLLAVVPLFAIAFGVAEGFGYRGDLEDALASKTQELPEYLQAAVTWIQDLVDKTSFRGLGVVGSLLLAYAGLNLFIRVEQALNQAWRSRDQRAWVTRISSFLALVFIVPLTLLAAIVSVSTLRGGPWVEALRADYPYLMALYDAGLWLVPYLLAGLAFTALYKFMPSVRVRWFPAAIAGLVTGVAVLVMHGIYVQFQVGVARANAIYATLTALPLLLIYLQAVWMLVLVGAEVCYAVQNLHRIGPGRDLDRAAPAVRERLAVWLVHRASARFAAGEGALGLADAATEIDLPREWLDQVSEELVAAELLAPVRGGGVVPARPVDRIDFRAVVDAVRGSVPPRLRGRMELPPELGALVREHGDPEVPGPAGSADETGDAVQDPAVLRRHG